MPEVTSSVVTGDGQVPYGAVVIRPTLEDRDWATNRRRIGRLLGTGNAQPGHREVPDPAQSAPAGSLVSTTSHR